MNKREITLINAGMKLFAEKGFHQTSVEDIAMKAGVSKGAFYLAFDSKEAFVTTAIEYFHDKLLTQIREGEKNQVPRKQLFIDQINIIVSYVYRYREFIMMFIQEDVSFGRHAQSLFREMKIDNFYWLKDNVKEIYGDKVDQYIYDAIIQLDGLLNGYFKWIVIDGMIIDRSRIGSFIVERLDDVITGMQTKGNVPLVAKEQVSLTFDPLDNNRQNYSELRLILTSMKSAINQLDIANEQKSELIEVCEMLQTEQEKVVIQGLLAHFQSYPKLHVYCEQLATFFQIVLLKDE